MLLNLTALLRYYNDQLIQDLNDLNSEHGTKFSAVCTCCDSPLELESVGWKHPRALRCGGSQCLTG